MGVPEGYKALAKIGISYKGEYDSTVTYENLDAVYYKGSTYLALIDSPLGVPNDDGTNWKYLAQGFGSDVSAATVDFEEASERENIETGETIKTVFGKAKKWFTDLTAAAFAQMITSYADIMANTTSGHLVDALAVKEGYEAINNNLGNIQYQIFYNTLGTESHSKPWLEIKAQIDNIPISKNIIGLVSAGATYTITGFKANNDYATFLVFSYTGEMFYVWQSAGMWMLNVIDIGTAITF